ncbi:hypothetical protein HDU76_003436 [Blyttiomyces sp. JEL0837]|nr:hypothetical protein HDU76_003436 [Blyttiomyces sp. JEL0837]
MFSGATETGRAHGNSSGRHVGSWISFLKSLPGWDPQPPEEITKLELDAQPFIMSLTYRAAVISIAGFKLDTIRVIFPDLAKTGLLSQLQYWEGEVVDLPGSVELARLPTFGSNGEIEDLDSDEDEIRPWRDVSDLRDQFSSFAMTGAPFSVPRFPLRNNSNDRIRSPSVLARSQSPRVLDFIGTPDDIIPLLHPSMIERVNAALKIALESSLPRNKTDFNSCLGSKIDLALDDHFALQWCCHFADVETVSKLLKEGYPAAVKLGAIQVKWESKDALDDYELHDFANACTLVVSQAALHGNSEMLQLGFSYNNVDLDFNDALPLRAACRSGNLKVVETLLRSHPCRQEPKDDESTTLCSDVMARNGSSLRMAVESGNLDTVRALIDIGGANGAIDGGLYVVLVLSVVSTLFNPTRDLSRLMNLAAKYGSLQVLKRLFEVDAAEADGAKIESLCQAAKFGRDNIIRWIAEVTDVNSGAKNNFAIRVAAKNGHLKVVQTLLEFALDKIDPSAQDNEALFEALKRIDRKESDTKHCKIFYALIRSGKVDISARDFGILKWIITTGRTQILLKIIELLDIETEAGRRWCQAMKDHYSELMEAAELDINESLIEYLKSMDVDSSSENKDTGNVSPLQQKTNYSSTSLRPLNLSQ